MPKLTLLVKFSLISFVLLAVIGALLGWALTTHMEINSIEQQKTALSSLVLPNIGPHLDEKTIREGATGDKYRAIEKSISFLGIAGLVRVKVWNRDGVIVYSDDPDLIGQKFEVEHDLEEAFEGAVVAEVSHLESDENILERGYGELLEIYTPLQMATESAPSSVFEGYYDLTDLRANIAATNNYLWTSVGTGFGFLYLCLFTIVRNASNKLTRQNEENARLYKQAQQRLTEREKAEAETRRQMERLGALRNIDIAITSTHELRLTLDVVLDKVLEQLKVDAACVLLLDSATRTLTVSAMRGFRSDAAQGVQLRLGEGYAGKAALQHRTLSIPNMSNTGDMERALLLAGEEFVSYMAVPLVSKGEVQGVLEVFTRTPLQPDDEWLGFLETLAGQAAIAVDNANLFGRLQRSNVGLALAYDNTLEGWSRALDLRDKETEGHSQRVTEMAVRLATLMGLDGEDIVHLRRGALLHDIGKMAIPDAILLKPGKLDAEEWAIMKMHPVYAYEMLSPIEFLRPALDIPYCHHEKWDGTGYPRGLKGEEIPIAARIFAIVDVWDALRSDRPYRTARSKEMVYALIREGEGKHFDPAVVEAFMRMQSEPSHLHRKTQPNLSNSVPFLALQQETGKLNGHKRHSHKEPHKEPVEIGSGVGVMEAHRLN